MKTKIWVYKNEDGLLKPFAFIAPREGRIAEYVQPDIDKFMTKVKGVGSVVKAEVMEVKN